jgi:hypothetical protein
VSVCTCSASVPWSCQLHDSQCCMLGWTCVRVGGVEVLDRMEGHGGDGVTAVGSLGWHQRLGWGRCSGCHLNDC